MAKDILRQAYRQKANSDSKALPTPSTIREPSNAEVERLYVPVGYRRLVCFHEKLYFESCKACRRTKADGQRNFDRYINSQCARVNF